MRSAAFGFTGFLYPCFAAALIATFRHGWLSTLAAGLIALDGVGRMGAGIFACDPGCGGVSQDQELHHLFATVGFLSGVLSAIAWGIIFWRKGRTPLLAGYCVVSGLLALTFLLLMTWDGNPVHAVGLFEHLATAVLSLWILVFAVHVNRSTLIPEAR